MIDPGAVTASVFVAPTLLEAVGAALFALALLHTFAAGLFERLAARSARHAGLWHLLGEIEVVFGFWAGVLVLFMVAWLGAQPAVDYLEARNFTEPLFVFAIMAVAGTRPVLQLAGDLVLALARLLPLARPAALFWVVLALVPLLGSLITEPAAMTLAALMLRDSVFSHARSGKLLYAALGTLFVNVSIGGTLTAFAAPPVLMVAQAWGWDSAYMFLHFGAPAALAVLVNATLVTALFYRQLAALPAQRSEPNGARVPPVVVGIHLVFLAAVVLAAHHAVVVIGLFLFFMGFTTAYARHQERLILREALLVAFFLAGLVVLGGQQRWWLEPLLLAMNDDAVYFGAAALTAITDNAALTYLGAQVPGLSESFKQALVAGAVTGGGLTVIANAPNPAGVAILRSRLPGAGVNPLALLAGAAVPTLVAMAAFRAW